jgi:hypothetical protein
MSGAAAEAVEGFLEAPVCAGFGVGTTLRGNADTDFIVRESGLAEGVLGVTLLGDPAQGDGATNE